MSVTRPKRPQFRPTVEKRISYVEEDTGLRVTDENPAYEEQHQAHIRRLWLYERSRRQWLVAAGKTPRPPWHREEIGVGIERCPEPGRQMEHQPWVLQAAARRRGASKS